MGGWGWFGWSGVVEVVTLVLVVGFFEEAKCPKKKKVDPLQDHAASGW